MPHLAAAITGRATSRILSFRRCTRLARAKPDAHRSVQSSPVARFPKPPHVVLSPHHGLISATTVPSLLPPVLQQKKKKKKRKKEQK
jgi:hypothetical protein